MASTMDALETPSLPIKTQTSAQERSWSDRQDVNEEWPGTEQVGSKGHIPGDTVGLTSQGQAQQTSTRSHTTYEHETQDQHTSHRQTATDDHNLGDTDFSFQLSTSTNATAAGTTGRTGREGTSDDTGHEQEFSRQAAVPALQQTSVKQSDARIAAPNTAVVPQDKTTNTAHLGKSHYVRSQEQAFDLVPAVLTSGLNSSGTAVSIKHRSPVEGLRVLTTNTAEGEVLGSGAGQPRPVSYRSNSTPTRSKSEQMESTSLGKQVPVMKPKPLSRASHLRTKSPHCLTPEETHPSPGTLALPPLSLPTLLQLELSWHRPRNIIQERLSGTEPPYESSRAKIERLLNFLFLPHQLEGVLFFGTLACLDSWLYTFTILPLRLLKSLYMLAHSWASKGKDEVHFVVNFIHKGTRRMWHRLRTGNDTVSSDTRKRRASEAKHLFERTLRAKMRNVRHRRKKSAPSTLLPEDKADLLKGLLIICTTMILLRLDASRMYHWVRGQAAIKLYVIYNVLEVFDRLLSAIGQDVLECLFSRETLERKPNGHSKVLRPFWLFVLALFYTVIHSTGLFYQVVTLNVAVNSYSNALITLLMSNQFVEIKSTVFKKFEKDNLFQLTCADIVERFQLWHMLLIIAARNVAETGGAGTGTGMSVFGNPSTTALTTLPTNTSVPLSRIVPPKSAAAILPSAFTFLPSVFNSIHAYLPALSHVFSPFVIVLGSEMVIDWLKHAYINKFNNLRPLIYSRFLDVLAKDYYTNAFGDQHLTKRLGLPVIPLSCLLIRASVQTYHMFVAAWVPPPSPLAASLASIHQHYSASRNATPSSTAAVVAGKIDAWLYNIPSTIADSTTTSYFTTILVVLLGFLILLACKLILGVLLLAFSRSRCRQMDERDRSQGHFVEGGRRVGGWGVVEVDDDKRRRIYEDDAVGLRTSKDREAKDQMRRENESNTGNMVDHLAKVNRYDMVAKRIW